MRINNLFVNKKYKKDIYNAVDEVLLDFPILNEINIVIHMKSLNRRLKASFASHRNNYGNKRIQQEIKLNPRAFLFSDIEQKLLCVRDANYETVKDIIWHELGHCTQIYLLCDYYKLNMNDYCDNIDYFYMTLNNNNRQCFVHHMNYYLQLSQLTKNKIRQLLGEYAVEEPAEFIPECFNNYYRLINKPELSKIEQEILKFVELIIKDLKKYLQYKERI